MPTNRSMNGRHHVKKIALPALDDIKKDIDSLQSDVADLAMDVRKAGSDKAQEAITYLNNRVDLLKNSGVEAIDKIEDHIKSRPRQSIAVAFAVGILASYFLGRKS
jgi:ElaB/YqjD/DUF883 family membrane-anchored ribosome-binding protein